MWLCDGNKIKSSAILVWNEDDQVLYYLKMKDLKKKKTTTQRWLNDYEADNGFGLSPILNALFPHIENYLQWQVD